MLGVQMTAVVDASGLAFRTYRLDERYAWSRSMRLREDERTILFMIDRLPIQWISKSAFTSTAENSGFVEFVRAQIARSTLP